MSAAEGHRPLSIYQAGNVRRIGGRERPYLLIGGHAMAPLAPAVNTELLSQSEFLLE